MRSLHTLAARLGRGARLAAAALLALSVGPVAGCTGCAGEPAGAAGPDGGAAGATSSTTSTGATTSSTASTGAGGAVPGCEQLEGWSHLAGVDPACVACVPDSLGGVSPLVWAPCEDGTPGCEQFARDWSWPEQLGPFYSNFAGSVTPAGPVITIGRVLGSEPPGWYEMVLARAGGPVLGAVRGRGGVGGACMPVVARINPSRLIASVAHIVTSTISEGEIIDYQIEIPLDTAVTRVFNTLTPEILHGNNSHARSAGPLFAAVSLNPTSEILTVPYDGSAPTVIAKWSWEHQWTPEWPIAVGPDVLFLASYQDRYRAYVYHSETGTTESYLDVPGFDVMALRTDGETLVWVQASPPYDQNQQGFPSAVELWRSPLSPSPAGLVPDKVADLAPALANIYLHFESGLVVFSSSLWQPPSPDMSWSRKVVLRLADMVYWNVDAPPGTWWGGTMYADTDEIAMGVQPPWYESQTYTVRRQQLSALGPPTPVEGVLGVP